MFYFFFLALTGILLNFITISHKAKYFILYFLSSSLLIFRFDVGMDYLEFMRGSELQYFRKIEYSWIIICEIFGFFGLGGKYVILFYGLITVLILHLVMKRINYSLNFIYIYLFFPHFYLTSYNLVRSWLSVILIWYLFISYRFLGSKINMKAVFLYVAAVLNHYSSSFILVFILLDKIKCNIFLKTIFLLAFLFLGLFLIKNFNLINYSHYIFNSGQDYNLYLLIYLVLFYLFFYFVKLKSEFLNIQVYSFYAIFICLFLIYFFTVNPVSLYRPIYYFLFIIPLWFSIDAERTVNLMIIKSLFARFFMPIYFMYFVYNYGNFYHLDKYQSIFNIG